MSQADRVVLEFALHRDNPSHWIVSRVGDVSTIVLPKRGCTIQRPSGRFATGPRGLKLAVVEIDMPAWLAKDRGL